MFALGADGRLYFATTSHGMLYFDPGNNTSANAGSTSYSQAVASGDGHIYFLRSDGTGVDAYP